MFKAISKKDNDIVFVGQNKVKSTRFKVNEMYFENFAAVGDSEASKNRLKLADDDPRFDINKNTEVLTFDEYFKGKKMEKTSIKIKVKQCGDFKLHYRSLLTDQSQKPTSLLPGSDPFHQIIYKPKPLYQFNQTALKLEPIKQEEKIKLNEPALSQTVTEKTESEQMTQPTEQEVIVIEDDDVLQPKLIKSDIIKEVTLEQKYSRQFSVEKPQQFDWVIRLNGKKEQLKNILGVLINPIWKNIIKDSRI